MTTLIDKGRASLIGQNINSLYIVFWFLGIFCIMEMFSEDPLDTRSVILGVLNGRGVVFIETCSEFYLYGLMSFLENIYITSIFIL